MPIIDMVTLGGGIVGLVGGSLAIIKTVIDIVNSIRDQSRVVLRILRVQRYQQRYHKGHFNGNYGSPSPNYDPTFLLGKIKEEFVVVEFEIFNPQKNPITISKIEINDWIFASEYVEAMYAPKRDYRVYDLYTKDRVSLADNVKIEPAQVIGRRVEIAEHTDGPEWVSNHSRYSIPEYDNITLMTLLQKGRCANFSKRKWETVGIIGIE